MRKRAVSTSSASNIQTCRETESFNLQELSDFAKAFSIAISEHVTNTVAGTEEAAKAIADNSAVTGMAVGIEVVINTKVDIAGVEAASNKTGLLAHFEVALAFSTIFHKAKMSP